MSTQPRPASRPILVLGGLAALLALVALAAIVPALRLFAQDRKDVKLSSPLVLVPENTAFFIHIRVEELTRSELFKLIVPVQEQPRFLQEICFGMPVEQVETVTIVSEHSPLLAMVDPRAPFDFVPRRGYKTMKTEPLRTEPTRTPLRTTTPEPTTKTPVKTEPTKIAPVKTEPTKIAPVRIEPARRTTAVVRKAQTPVAFQKEIKEPPPFKDDFPKDSRPGFGKDDFDKFDGFGPRGFPGREDPGVVIVTMRNDIDVEDIILMRPERTFKSKKGRAMLEIGGLTFHRLNRRTMVAAETEQGLDKFLDRPIPKEIKGPLAPALEKAASGKHTLTIGQALAPKALEQAADGMRDDPEFRFRRGMPGMVRTMLPLLAARPGVVTVDLGQKPAVAAELHYADEAAAKKAVRPLQDVAVLIRIFGLGILEEELLMRRAPLSDDELHKAVLEKLLIDAVEEALVAAPVERKGTTVQVAAVLPMTLDALADKAKLAAKEQLKNPKFLEGRRRAVSSNNLKQIAIALHAYHDTYKGLPPQAICDANGKPLLSWRVAILPFIEQQPLYQQFRLNEPWDSEHNIKLLDKMPAIYAPPGIKTKEPHTTFYQGFVGPNTAFELRPNGGAKPFGANGLRMADFLDGTSNVWMMAEAAEAVPWSKPADMKYDPKGPLPKLGGLFSGGFHAAFTDGWVRYYPRPLADKTMHIVITRNNGMVRPFEVRD